MAEVLALAASVCGVAAYGTTVATTLYGAADVMLHAREQIAQMAKHVSQFAAALRQLGGVLKADKDICSSTLLDQIRQIKRSSRSTFKEIDKIVNSRKLRYFASVRWLFNKAKARELESRLESQKSTLQLMIHTITVSKLADVQSRSKEGSQHMADLRDEFALLKTTILENYNNLKELQRAEIANDADARARAARKSNIHRIRKAQHRSTVDDLESRHSSPGPQPSFDESASWEDSDTVRGLGDLDESSEGALENTHGEVSHSAMVHVPKVARIASGHGGSRASTMLLEWFPYSPQTEGPQPSGRFIAAGPFEGEDEVKSDGVTNMAHFLLDRWTISGWRQASALLEEQDPALRRRRGDGQYTNRARFNSPERQSDISETERHDASKDIPRQGVPRGRYRERDAARAQDFAKHSEGHPLPYRQTTSTRSSIVQRHLWLLPYARSQPRDIGEEILRGLRLRHGGIIYAKGNGAYHAYYVDGKEFYRFRLLPPSLEPPKAARQVYTEISKGWASPASLDLLGYSYTEPSPGLFSVPHDLDLTEIEDLVRLSYQGVSSSLRNRTRRSIEENGWQERIAVETEAFLGGARFWDDPHQRRDRSRSYDRRNPLRYPEAVSGRYDEQ